MRAIGLAGCVMLTWALTAGAARAVEPGEVLPDARMEQRARGLSAELRCLVCQNQSIDDSNAPLAKDLRVLVRERLVAGDTDRQVLDYIVDRYGEFVLLRPPIGWHTLLLWATPLVVLAAAAAWIALRVRAGRGTVPEVALSPDERRRLQALLAEPDDAAPR